MDSISFDDALRCHYQDISISTMCSHLVSTHDPSSKVSCSSFGLSFTVNFARFQRAEPNPLSEAHHRSIPFSSNHHLIGSLAIVLMENLPRQNAACLLNQVNIGCLPSIFPRFSSSSLERALACLFSSRTATSTDPLAE